MESKLSTESDVGNKENSKNQPIPSYLPWVRVRLEAAIISIHNTFNHLSGLINIAKNIYLKVLNELNIMILSATSQIENG